MLPSGIVIDILPPTSSSSTVTTPEMLSSHLIRNHTTTRRCFSVLQSLKSEIAPGTKNTTNNEPAKFESLTPDQLAYLDRVIRVDQAGELGANYIYRGQIFILSKKYPHLRPILQHMWEQEVFHHDTFNNLQLQNRVRPSLITPLWKIGAVVMGAGTALISKEAAMACTEAVETVIGGHYNEQLRCLNDHFKMKKLDNNTVQSDPAETIKTVKEFPTEIKSLVETIQLFRDQELEHLDTAINYDSRMAVPYMMITEVIKGVCKAAIWTAERI